MKSAQLQDVEIELHQIKRLYDGMLKEFQRSKIKGEEAARDREIGSNNIQTLAAQILDLRMTITSLETTIEEKDEIIGRNQSENRKIVDSYE